MKQKKKKKNKLMKKLLNESKIIKGKEIHLKNKQKETQKKLYFSK